MAAAVPSPAPSLKSRWLAFYHKYEKYSEIAVFCLGFLWDALTLTRIDNMLDNVILLFYLLIIAAMIILTIRGQLGAAFPKIIRKVEKHLLWAMQFCFGGLFSSYVVFYFKSASWTKTLFFFLVLVSLFIGNEFLHNRLKNQALLAVLFTFCLFSFLAFFLPVVMQAVGGGIFGMAGILTLILSFAVFGIAFQANRVQWRRNMFRISPWICSVWLAINGLYFFSLIPPVPLALKAGRPYHHVARTPSGYEVQYVEPPFYRFWRKWDDPFYFSKGEKVYCYTAIFAPKKVRTPIRHVWSYRAPNGWVQTDRISFSIAGGREGGYRGYSFKSGVKPGKWRVGVETEQGQMLGVVEFSVLPSPEPHPPLVKQLLE